MSSIRSCIEKIGASRKSQVLVFGSSQLEIHMLAPLYEALSQLKHGQNLDVVFYSRGGVVNAARRIALLFREFADRVSFLVPYFCESAGTVTALSADEIVAGPLAVFSPIDPLLTTGRSGGADEEALALSAQDLRLFSEMSIEWYDVEPSEAKAQALQTLCDNIFPSTLTSFYRSTLEMQEICAELLALHMMDDHELRRKIAEKLIFGYHSHTFALTRNDLKTLGLPIEIDRQIEELMWPIVRELCEIVGRGSCLSPEDDWFDVYIATRHGARVRRFSNDFAGLWQEWELS